MARPKKPAPALPRRPWRATVAVIITVLIVVASVVALGQIGDEALRRIGARDRYRAPFADIACDPPPGLDRPTFLAEVRYVGELPETVSALDPADRDRLAAGFAKHPWVDRVDGVTAEPGGVVRVALRFRVPVLVVSTTDGETRLLDRHAILLPLGPTPPGVAELTGTIAPPPRVVAGEVWDDREVRWAVELTTAYGAKRLDRATGGWKLTLADGKHLVVGR